jgi:S1-C subfamily serine protease
VGAGVLGPYDHILTCAHVVSDSAGPPDHPVFVEFQFAGPQTAIEAWVTDDGWIPEQLDHSGDLAVLRLAKAAPAGAQAAPLQRADQGVQQHKFQVYGYPQGHDKGVWSTGTIVGAAGIEWLQLQSDSQLGYALERGFSGAAVWDQSLAAVVGIVVARDRRYGSKGDPRVGFAIPVDVMEHHWPQLVQSIQDIVPREARQAAGPQHIQNLLEIHERNVRILEEQKARFGDLAPVHIITQLEDEKRTVEQLNSTLKRENGWDDG